ncbi:S8 family serine peptidase [Gemmatimonas phototrophica]|uniref:S8 family serine peptidase n=1 Tax=Gemmatimonas phototrophica TaxID=1379270 RepID=UPI0013147B61|nr:S8 family serine peptidase [Gemmatimonas phototrophica]
MLALLTLVTGACSDVPTGTAGPDPDARTSATSTSTATITGFGFLPPTVKNPAPVPGTFDATRKPTVRVVCTAPSGPSCPTVATFAMGPGSDGIRVDAADESYAVLWRVPSSLAIGGGTYRLEVLDGAQIIGRADLLVARTTQDANRITAPGVAVVAGKPILIKFRITSMAGGALSGPSDAPAADVVPDSQSAVRREDFAQGHPILVGIDVSFNTVMLRLAPTATVGETNAMLAQVGASLIGGARGVAERAPALLVLRFPTTTHAALAERIAQLRGYAIVLGVSPDVLQQTEALPRSGELPIPEDWTWELPSTGPGGGNWGLEVARVPQMWHFNGIVSREGVSTRTGVWEIDTGPGHNDLPTAEWLPSTYGDYDDHPTAVASILGATHNNGGMDGVSPFVQLVTGTHGLSDASDAMPLSLTATVLDTWVNSGLRVVNTSWGLDYLKGKPASTAPEITAIADEHGRVISDVLFALELLGRRLPIFVASAGNYSKDGVLNPSQYAGAMKNASLVHGVAAILTIEALAQQPGGAIVRSSFSSVGGALSAPGAGVLVATYSNGYAFASGTSFAAPFVTGIVSYLYSLYPALPAPTTSSNPVRELLQANSVAVALGTAPRVDAFATALDADRVMGGTRALRGLLDIDDGTQDGNTRVNLANGAEDLGGVMGGNGRIDMQDFRRWRDWLLQAENPAGLSLDGRADHPKRDLNGDGLVKTPAEENVFARGDFNGDGIISPNDRAVMPASLARANLTDLEVMQRLFDDPLYTSQELPALVRSADLHIATDLCTLGVGERLRIRVVQTAGAYTKEVIAPAGDARVVLTVPVTDRSEYVVELAKIAQDGTVLDAKDSKVELAIGSDRLVRTDCVSFRITTELLPRGKIGVPYSAQMAAINNTGPITWSNPNATLPAGLTINARTGLISGTPTDATSRSVSIMAESEGESTFRSYGIRIDPALTIISSGLPATDSGAVYYERLRVIGASAAPTWSIVSGALPNGISLSSIGELTGKSTQIGTFTFTVQASAGGEVATRVLSIIVRPPTFTVTVQIRMVNFFSGTVAKVTSDPLGLTRLDTGGVCEYSSSRDFGLLVLCRVSQRRGSTAVFKLETLSIFRWFDATGRCSTGTTCNVLFDDPDPLVKSRNLSLDLNL